MALLLRTAFLLAPAMLLLLLVLLQKPQTEVGGLRPFAATVLVRPAAFTVNFSKGGGPVRHKTHVPPSFAKAEVSRTLVSAKQEKPLQPSAATMLVQSATLAVNDTKGVERVPRMNNLSPSVASAAEVSRRPVSAEQEGPLQLSQARCSQLELHHGVRPGQSWGTLPSALQREWAQLDCDRKVTHRLPKSTPSKTTDAVTWEAQYLQAQADSLARRSASQRLAAWHSAERMSGAVVMSICVATTSRKIRARSLSDFSLFSFMLPSLSKSLSPAPLPSGQRISYSVYIAHDAGDAFFDTLSTRRQIDEWIRTELQLPLVSTGITITGTSIAFANAMRKPGPVFNFMMAAAYEDGADYLYRVNDDTMFDEPGWAQAAIVALQGLEPPNVGVVGPLCAEGNTRIMTHDLVHRTHLQIFSLYYPAILSDWWMDDWISHVYGPSRTGKGIALRGGQGRSFLTVDSSSNAAGLWRVHHRVSFHGTRYNVDHAHAQKLAGELKQGVRQIAKWLGNSSYRKSSSLQQPNSRPASRRGLS
mmetsp:Transcript_13425/g.28949  ORF Transcript_13425/g.28949 Transcript_13425/m.28949 type:complete len:531 (+) Transcript_13425:342-1934(+)